MGGKFVDFPTAVVAGQHAALSGAMLLPGVMQAAWAGRLG